MFPNFNNNQGYNPSYPNFQPGFPPQGFPQPGFGPQVGFGQPQFGYPQPGFGQPNYQGYGQPPVVNFTEDVFYHNGKKKYDSFHKHFFFENGQKAYDGFHNHAFYDNGQKVFDGFHGHVYYRNGKQAYDGFFYKANYENGNPLGKSGVNYSAQGVSMNLAENVDDFHIVLSNNSSISVSIGENPKFKSVKLYLDGQYVLSKTL